MSEFIVPLACALLSAGAIRIAMLVAPVLRLIDLPGEHKQHDTSTPFVGGVGIFLALLCAGATLAVLAPQHAGYVEGLVAASFLMFATGLSDDIYRLGFRIRLVIQAVAALVMIFVSGVVLNDLGGLFFNTATPLGVFAIPFTIFATIGVINALNMIDGMDGLAGSIAFMSLLVISFLVIAAGDVKHALLCLGVLGGIGGFLVFNMRHGKQKRARVFMGDNGSMLLGLFFGWLLIDLSQGEAAIIAPVAAIWLFAVPLIDTVSVMLRRLWLRKSPFSPDRSHLHHLLQAAGYRVEDVVIIMALLQFLLAAGGVAALALGVSEGVMLVGFLAVFTGYFYITLRPWRAVPAMRRLHGRLGLLPAASCGIYFGQCAVNDAKRLMDVVAHELGQATSFRIRIFERATLEASPPMRYALVDVMLEDEQASLEDIRHYARVVKRSLREHQGVYVRPLVARSTANDPRSARRSHAAEQRRGDRRDPSAHILVMEAVAYTDGDTVIEVHVNDEKPHPEVPVASGLPHVPRPAPARREMGPRVGAG